MCGRLLDRVAESTRVYPCMLVSPVHHAIRKRASSETRTGSTQWCDCSRWCGKMNAATKYVEASENVSPLHEYVSDHGQGVSQSELEHATVAGRSVTLSNDVNSDDQDLIADGIRVTDPAEKSCFNNSLGMWEFNERFSYVEGFAVMTDSDVGGIEHAWCLLDGEHLVDTTTAAFDHYYGVAIDDPEILRRYAEESPHEGILGNHKNRYAFLRDRGYVD